MKLYNTLTRKIEDFVPIDTPHVKMFACGPTVYDYLHIGNGRTAVMMDLLVRILRNLDYDVHYLVNITDIDDKIINRANEQGIDWRELTKKYEYQYKKDMLDLGVGIDQYARATDHIEDIIRQINTLMQKDYAYKTDDGIYFEISKFKDYGKLSGRKDIQKDDAQSRIDESDQKRGWNDFALWKFAKPGEPSWPAEFGEGRPGWHIEDTAITEHFFGPQYDIHGGGSDLIFPHHEAEITQMESASGLVPFVKYWVHSGMLYIDNQRMGKSNNNFITIKDALALYPASAIRLLFFNGHYRSQLNYSDKLMKSTVARLKRWQKVADLRWQPQGISDDITNDIKDSYQKIINHLSNDIDTPSAIAEIERIFETIEKNYLNNNSLSEFNKLLDLINNVLGINLLIEDINDEIKEILQTRAKARTNKDYQKSDELRDQLSSLGIEVSDIPSGQLWSRI